MSGLNITLPENTALENGWLEDEISFGDGLFAGAILVSGSVSKFPVYPTHFCIKLSKMVVW